MTDGPIKTLSCGCAQQGVMVAESSEPIKWVWIRRCAHHAKNA